MRKLLLIAVLMVIMTACGKDKLKDLPEIDSSLENVRIEIII